MNKKKIFATILLNSLFATIIFAQSVVSIKKGQTLTEAKSMNTTSGKKDFAKTYLKNTDANTALQANFSIRTDASDEIVWSENFDTPLSGWTFESSSQADLYWTVKTDLTGSYSFKAINPNDVGSLKSESPYQIYKRGTASANTPLIDLPRNAKVSFFLGCSTNFSTNCDLIFRIQKENSEVWDTLWNVNNAGLTPPNFTWRHINIDLAAYSSQKVKISWAYNGYMGNFYLDSIAVSGVKPIDQIAAMTGEKIEFIDLSAGEPAEWEWSFPEGTPATSTAQNPLVYYTKDGVYDVSLTVKNATDNSSTTKTAFVKVTGSAPVAIIQPPASFRNFSTRNAFIAPLQPVEYKDASTNFPTERQWVFSGINDVSSENYTTSDSNPKVGYKFRNGQVVGLSVSNQHGQSSALMDVTVGYDGLIWNLQPTDQLFTFNLSDGYGSFPGSNTLKITDYAEKFSKPSVPSLIYGVNVYFSEYKATEVIEQIAPISVSIHKSENGLPGEKLDFAQWSAFEIELGGKPTTFEFDKPVLVDDEFFIVVNGIPEYNDGCNISFLTSKFRNQGNTSYFKQKNEWKQASNYFPAGANHTSYAIAPYIIHSVILPLSETPVKVGSLSGVTQVEFFSIMGYEVKSVSENWCRVVGQPNGLTLDTIKIAYDALPENISERTAFISLSDGVQTVKVQIIQNRSNVGIDANVSEKNLIYPTLFTSEFTVNLPENSKRIDVYDLSGRLVFVKNVSPNETKQVITTTQWTKGTYLIAVESESGRRIVKGIKK